MLGLFNYMFTVWVFIMVFIFLLGEILVLELVPKKALNEPGLKKSIWVKKYLHVFSSIAALIILFGIITSNVISDKRLKNIIFCKCSSFVHSDAAF